MSKKLEDLRRIGPKSGVIQIVPIKGDMRPALVRDTDRDAHDLINRPLAVPTGPGGAKGFRNRAGSTIRQPAVMNVYLGPFWGDTALIEQFSKAVVENGYLDPLAELGYGTGTGTYLGSAIGSALAAGSSFTDAQARSTLRNMLDEGVLHGDLNSLFMLILPDKVVSEMSGSKSCTDYCGYHDAFAYNGTDIAYAVLPSSLCTGCGGKIGDFTAVYAHELAEACTDKVPGKGWVADDGSENGDLEAWILFGWGPPEDPNRYTIQGYYTNERGNTVGKWRLPSTPQPQTRRGAFVGPREEGTQQQLDPDTCTEIVVDNTPRAKNFRGPDQLLKDLGVVGDFEIAVHKSGIIKDLSRLGFSIDQNDISSGPAVNVGDCTGSVLDNAR